MSLFVSALSEDEDPGSEATVGSLSGHQQSTHKIKKRFQVSAYPLAHVSVIKVLKVALLNLGMSKSYTSCPHQAYFKLLVLGSSRKRCFLLVWCLMFVNHVLCLLVVTYKKKKLLIFRCLLRWIVGHVCYFLDPEKQGFLDLSISKGPLISRESQERCAESS